MAFNKILSMPIGMICLSIAILLERFAPDTTIIAFTVGLLTGLSLVLNVYYLYTQSRTRLRKQGNKRVYKASDR